MPKAAAGAARMSLNGGARRVDRKRTVGRLRTLVCARQQAFERRLRSRTGPVRHMAFPAIQARFNGNTGATTAPLTLLATSDRETKPLAITDDTNALTKSAPAGGPLGAPIDCSIRRPTRRLSAKARSADRSQSSPRTFLARRPAGVLRRTNEAALSKRMALSGDGRRQADEG
jgi:hypothetical protein